jgi:hypothetical protein
MSTLPKRRCSGGVVLWKTMLSVAFRVRGSLEDSIRLVANVIAVPIPPLLIQGLRGLAGSGKHFLHDDHFFFRAGLPVLEIANHLKTSAMILMGARCSP